MPISRDEFDRGRTNDSLSERILKFLNDNPAHAFSEEEIREHLGIPFLQEAQSWEDKIDALAQQSALSTKLLMLYFQKEVLRKSTELSSGSWTTCYTTNNLFQ